MLLHPLYETLRKLKLDGVIKGLLDQEAMPDIDQIPFMDRLALLMDREFIERENKRIASRLREAKLRQSASIEDLDFKTPRKLDRTLILKLGEGAWVSQHQNVLITGPTGVGKSYLACALGNQACRQGFKTRYLLLTRFLEEMAMSHADGSYAKLMAQLHKDDVLILDDFGLTSINAAQRHDLFNLIEDRYQLKATIITSQFPVAKWHDYLGEPTIADAILDRLTEHAHRIELKGPSMRNRDVASS